MTFSNAKVMILSAHFQSVTYILKKSYPLPAKKYIYLYRLDILPIKFYRLSEFHFCKVATLTNDDRAMRRHIIMSLSALLLMATTVHAGQSDSLTLNQKKLYVGARAGLPMAQADFSSFSADGFRPGWNLGINLGYRFTEVWSMELTAAWGQLFLAEKDCCFERNYFLGNDMNRYHPQLIPDAMLHKGWYYKDLMSRTFVQRYGLQVNMNILGIFAATKSGPWSLEISPAVYATGTDSDLVTKKDRTPFVKDINEWHLGYGGLIQASYAITDNMNIGLYGGYTQVTGKNLDGMPRLHSTNFIIDAGIKFTIGLGKSPKKGKHTESSAPVIRTDEPISPAINTDNVSPVVREEDNTVEVETVTADEPSEAVPEDKTEDTQIEESPFPVIYFSFNSIWIEPGERAKVKAIADMMKADKSMRILVTGWCDPAGGEETNRKVSLQRAEAVKRVLGQWLVSTDRIETSAGGIKHDAANDAEARNATTTIIR